MADTPKTTSDLLKARYYTEEEFTLDDGVTKVTARVDDRVVKRIRKYLPILLEQRGLLTLDSTDDSHPDVVKKLQARARSNPDFARVYKRRQQGRTLRGEDLEIYTRYMLTAIQAVQAVQKPQTDLLLFQITAWSVLYQDLFTVAKGSFEFRLDDIEVPESYWMVGVETDAEVDPLDDLMGGFSYSVKPFEIDRKNPLEIMIALTTTLISNPYNPKFADALQPVLQAAMAFVLLEQAWGDLDVDEAGFQLKQLDGDLAEEVQPENPDEERPKSGGRKRKATSEAES